MLLLREKARSSSVGRLLLAVQLQLQLQSLTETSFSVAGGEERVCLLDHEVTVVPGTMRATGDWVDVRDSQLRFLGRRDRLIKRHGKRVNLDSVQQVRRFFFIIFYIGLIH